MSIPVPGTNLWATSMEADAYFADKYNASAWAALTNAQKAQLLISAFNWINRFSAYSIPASLIDPKVKFAQFEAAWFLYHFNDEGEKRSALHAQGVRSFRVSEFSENLDEQTLPVNIQGLLIGFVSGVGDRTVTVTRQEKQNTGYGEFR